MVYDIGDWTLKFRNFENLRWRQPPYWKNQKIAISQQWLDWFLQNLAQWCRMGSLTVSAVNILNFKNSRWWTAVMLRTVKLWYLHKHLDEFDKIWHDNAYWLPIAYWLLKLGSTEIPRWWRPSHWKVKKFNISATAWPLFTKFGAMIQKVPYASHMFKNLNINNPRRQRPATSKWKSRDVSQQLMHHC